MSFSDKPREPRAQRRARPRISLKMQAIGFLSRREHSRQELRMKLLDSLRKRAREEAALAAAAEKAALELAEALRAQPSNGIDDAFAPTLPASPPARGGRGRAGGRTARGGRDAQAPSRAHEGAAAGASAGGAPANGRNPALDRPALDTLSLASGAPLPTALRASLAAVAATTGMAMEAPATSTATRPGRSPAVTSSAAATTPTPSPTPRHASQQPSPPRPLATHRTPTQETLEEFIDLEVESFDDLPAAPTGPLDATDLELSDPEAAVDDLLDWLVANKYLSETRFVESRVNARSRKQGALLIKLELARHGLALEPEQAATLRETEFARAQALWQRKFGEVAPDARLRARQARFLAARGFAADVVRRVVGGEEEF